jgi:hypothetical protein
MSLDIYLRNKKCVVCGEGKAIDFDFNITHNLSDMAEACGIYHAMWRPEEIGISQAKYLIPLLESGVKNLKEHKSFYEKFNPLNGWGDYNNLLERSEYYLQKCKDNPDAEVDISR